MQSGENPGRILNYIWGT